MCGHGTIGTVTRAIENGLVRARMAQWAAKGRLRPGEVVVHESIIGSMFDGRVEAEARVGDRPAIIPSTAGWARMTGYNTIFIDDRDPYAKGFQVI
jgi:4-hydroxyproline epimerase